MKNAFLFLFSIVLLSGCRLEYAKHDPMKAVSDANVFMKALYLDEHYQKAFEISHPELRRRGSPGDLLQIIERIKQQVGGLRRLKADSYFEGHDKTVEVFYIGTYERGVIYHRIVLTGDTSNGYKVSGVWLNTEPYPEIGSRYRFKNEIFVE